MRVIPRTSWISARLLSGVVSGDAHRLVVVLDHVLHVRTVRIPAEDDADGRILMGLSHRVVQQPQVGVQLAQIDGLEGTALKFHRHQNEGIFIRAEKRLPLF